MRTPKGVSATVTAFLLSAVIFAVPAGAKAGSAADQVLTHRTFIDLAKKVRPSVVSIKINVETLEKIEEWRRERRAKPRTPERR